MSSQAKSPRTTGRAVVKSSALAKGRAAGRALPGDDPLSGSRVRYLLGTFTGKRLAEVVGVSASQPTQWAAGKERPGPGAAARLLDLEHVLAKARLVWGPDGALDWLDSPNARFDGNARPIDVLLQRGASPVLDALDGEMWNNYA